MACSRDLGRRGWIFGSFRPRSRGCRLPMGIGARRRGGNGRRRCRRSGGHRRIGRSRRYGTRGRSRRDSARGRSRRNVCLIRIRARLLVWRRRRVLCSARRRISRMQIDGERQDHGRCVNQRIARFGNDALSPAFDVELEPVAGRLPSDRCSGDNGYHRLMPHQSGSAFEH
jgi:hypothetical protein